MRWVGLAIVFLSIPLFAALLGRENSRRDIGILLIGLLVFVTGTWSHAVSVYAWPAWQGISKGVFLSLVDSLVIAMLLTRPPGRYRIPFLPLILLYLLTVIVSAVPALNRVATLFTIIQLFQMLILYVVVASELHRPNAYRHLLIGLSLGMMFQAAYVIREKLGGMVQAPGTMEHQNVLGMMVELSLLPLIAAVMEGERNKLIYGGVIAGAICIAGTGSRGTMGFFAIGLAFLVLLSLIRKASGRKWQIVGLGVLGAILVVPLGLATLQDRFGNWSFETQESARITLEASARQMAEDNLLGVGANNFVTANNVEGYLGRTGTPLTEATRRQPTHNAYLLARAETGWAGEIALILLLGGLACGGILVAFRFRNNRAVGVALGSSAAILAVALHSNFEYALHKRDLQILLFLNAGLIAGLGALGARHERAGRRAQREARARQSQVGDDPVPAGAE